MSLMESYSSFLSYPTLCVSLNNVLLNNVLSLALIICHVIGFLSAKETEALQLHCGQLTSEHAVLIDLS